MLLYHATTDAQHTGVFTPRLPDNIDCYDEDDTIDRICVSDSIEGCLTSMPRGGEDLRDLLDDTGDRIKVFVFDTDTLGLPPNCIIEPDVIKDQYGVIDAVITGEHWITAPVTIPTADTHILHVHDFQINRTPIESGIIVGRIEQLRYTSLCGDNKTVQQNACEVQA